jgi:hypothetical protein
MSTSKQRQTEYLGTGDAAERLGCSKSSVSRGARAKGVGIYVRGKLVALSPRDVEEIRGVIHETPGNPVWIAGGRGRK